MSEINGLWKHHSLIGIEKIGHLGEKQVRFSVLFPQINFKLIKKVNAQHLK